MPQVVVTFHDGEVLFAEIDGPTFDLPVLEAEIRNVDSNSERALLPVTAIREILVSDGGPVPSGDVLETWDRAAFHFTDGQVLRARIGPEPLLGRHGGVWTLLEPDAEETRVVGIPYTSLKGVFRIRQWDSRPAGERAARAAGVPVHLEAMVDALAERQARSTPGEATRRRPLADRMNRPRD